MQLDADTRVFLTGGTGFIGRHFRAALADFDVPVTLFVTDASDRDVRPTEQLQEGDVTDPETVCVTDHDIVVHLAAQTSIEAAIEHPRRTWAVNADGTLNVLEAARDANVERVLYASTASVYGPPTYLPIDESHPTNPAEPYGASKLAGDGLARTYASTYDLDVVIARLFNAFGPGQPSHNVVPAIVSQALDGGDIELGNLTPSRDFIYVADVVRALHTILTAGESGTAYNVGRGDDVSVGTLANMVVDLVDGAGDVVSTVDRQRDEDVEIPRHVADTTRLQALGWTPDYTVEDGLRELVAHSTS